MLQDSYIVGTTLLQQRSLYLLITKEEKQIRREALALLERATLSLPDKCFLFLYALEKMLGALDSSEVNRYFDGLELIGYPIEFIDRVSTGNSYPIAELSEYLDSHKYEVYQLRQEVQILKSIDNSLRQLIAMTFNSVKAYVEAEKVDDTVGIGSELKVDEEVKSTLADRLKAKLNENS
jgi:hypothetical protein